ncbi:MAG: hypothetical protein ACYC4U_16330 [Pirellulaceae bacterium]
MLLICAGFDPILHCWFYPIADKLQTLEAFQPLIDFQDQRGSLHRLNLYQHLLDAIAVHRVADRPDRFEPRKKKRRPKPYDRLMKSRDEAKRDILNGFSEN